MSTILCAIFLSKENHFSIGIFHFVVGIFLVSLNKQQKLTICTNRPRIRKKIYIRWPTLERIHALYMLRFLFIIKAYQSAKSSSFQLQLVATLFFMMPTQIIETISHYGYRIQREFGE